MHVCKLRAGSDISVVDQKGPRLRRLSLPPPPLCVCMCVIRNNSNMNEYLEVRWRNEKNFIKSYEYIIIVVIVRVSDEFRYKYETDDGNPETMFYSV